MNEIEEWLNSRIGLKLRSGLGMAGSDSLGNPERSYPTIRAGTYKMAKGSNIAFMRQLSRSMVERQGSFTSPHMISIHDRI